ncbi:hypothetical protein Cal7507_4135 [Calothrix sp. PCC 7507]|nr:hypothetical protein Cal7507_4135 [Calothrix sp. PCC 7507]
MSAKDLFHEAVKKELLIAFPNLVKYKFICVYLRLSAFNFL